MPYNSKLLNSLAYYLLLVTLVALTLWELISKRLGIILDPYQVRSDALQHNFPYWSYLSKDYFNDNYIADYYLNTMIPLGLKTLFSSLAHFFTPIQIGKYLALTLAIIFIILLTESAKHLSGKVAGALTAFFTTAYLARHFILADAISRSFGYVVVALGLYAIIKRQPWTLMIAACLGALFYPAAGAILACYCGLVAFWPNTIPGSFDDTNLSQKIFTLLGLGVVLLVLLVPMILGGGKYGERLYIKNQVEFPEAGLGGRYALQDLGINKYPLPIALYRSFNKVFLNNKDLFPSSAVLAPATFKVKEKKNHNLNSDRQLVFWTMIVIVFSGILVNSFYRKSKIDPNWIRVGQFLFSVVGIYYLAVLLFPHLYMPSRYPLISIPALALVVVPAAIVSFIRIFKSRILASGILVLLVAVLIHLSGMYQTRLREQMSYRTNAPIYDFLKKLPATTLIAGWPIGIIDSVPYFSGRGPFLTMETHQVFRSKYLLEMRARTYAIIDAYFDNSLGAILNLKNKFGVTHLILEKQYFKKAPKYFKPFDKYIKSKPNLISNQWTQIYQSPEVKSAIVFKHGSYVVIDLSLLS